MVMLAKLEANFNADRAQLKHELDGMLEYENSKKEIRRFIR